MCNKKDGLFFPERSYFCIMDKDHQMRFKKHTNLISSSRVCLMVTFSLFILSTMSIIGLRVSINCKDILTSYNKKITNSYIVSLLEFIIKK
jgi:hypothetical protein